MQQKKKKMPKKLHIVAARRQKPNFAWPYTFQQRSP